MSPPDAVSARAVLQRVRLPHRISILLEGESLLNDATGLVLFRIAIAAVIGLVLVSPRMPSVPKYFLAIVTAAFRVSLCVATLIPPLC